MLNTLFKKALQGDFLTIDEGVTLYNNAPLGLLMSVAHAIRMRKVPDTRVSWQIDRNVNYSNVCSCGCKFCNFFRSRNSKDAYVTTWEQYDEKVKTLLAYGGDQLLLQGGLHPDYGIDFYINLFKGLKERYPSVKLHALGPPEIVHISNKEGLSYTQTLTLLRDAGLESLPGAGAEILVDRVRKQISPRKCSSAEWLEVMRQAHKLNLLTSATMMYGHVETIEERMQHLVSIRSLQEERPQGHYGFMAFIAWPYQSKGTVLERELNNEEKPYSSAEDFLRMIAISRIMLPNITNIQSSWLTVGLPIGQMALYGGANDMGSIMIEENVVSAAGATHKVNRNGLAEAIKAAGFIPFRRNQAYEEIKED